MEWIKGENKGKVWKTGTPSTICLIVKEEFKPQRDFLIQRPWIRVEEPECKNKWTDKKVPGLKEKNIKKKKKK